MRYDALDDGPVTAFSAPDGSPRAAPPADEPVSEELLLAAFCVLAAADSATAGVVSLTTGAGSCTGCGGGVTGCSTGLGVGLGVGFGGGGVGCTGLGRCGSTGCGTGGGGAGGAAGSGLDAAGVWAAAGGATSDPSKATDMIWGGSMLDLAAASIQRNPAWHKATKITMATLRAVKDIQLKRNPICCLWNLVHPLHRNSE